MQRYNRNLNKEKIEILSKKVDTEETLLGQVENLLKLSDDDIAKAIQATKQELDKVKSEITDRIVRQIKGKEASEIVRNAKSNSSSISERVYKIDEADKKSIYMLKKQVNEIVEKRQAGEEVENVDSQIEQIISLDAQYDKLKDMVKKLENFPKVRSQIVRIKNVKDKAVIKKNKNKMALESSIGENNQKIEKLRKEQEEAENAKWDITAVLAGIDQKLNEIDKRTEELNNKDEITLEEREYLSGAAVKKQEYLAQKRSITKKLKEEEKKTDRTEEIKALESQNADIEKKLELYNTGKSKEDGVINRCNLAMRMLYEGKTWDEIELASVEELQKAQSKREQEQGNNSNSTKGQEQSNNPNPNKKTEPSKVPEPGKKDNDIIEYIPFEERNKLFKWISGIKFKGIGEAISKRANEFYANRATKKQKQDKENQTDEKTSTQRDSFMSYLRDIAEKGDVKYLSKEDQKRNLSISNRDKERDE